MRTPPVFRVCGSDTSVQALLGTNPVRLFPFGQARTETYPYAVWSIVYGGPENLLGDTPAGDRHGTQIDVYAKTWDSARAVANALQDAIEQNYEGYVVSYDDESVDPVTKNYRVSFTVDWITDR